MKTIPEFLLAFTNGDFDALEDIFSYKYQKVMICYRLLEDYLDSIKSLAYKTTKKDKFKLEVTFKKLDLDKIKHNIKNIIKKEELSPIVSIRVQGNALLFTVTREEDDEILY